jgi:hypothetical protein
MASLGAEFKDYVDRGPGDLAEPAAARVGG